MAENDGLIGVTVLGATGSVGMNTLDVLARHRDRYRVAALTAHTDSERLFACCREHRPELAVLGRAGDAAALQDRLREAGLDTQVLSGPEGLEAAARLPSADYVMAAIVGAAGLLPTLAAVRAGKRVMLANKEALVMTGRIFMDEVERCGAELLPIDSEHNAVFQCMPPRAAGADLEDVGVERILLTASGGPFRTTPLSELHAVTPEQACAHPNWVMGRKISVDSATMMNKGLEVIEACWLFRTTPERVRVVLHPQSTIHSMVEYVDGSILAHLATPDMRVPIAHALAWPGRMRSGAEPLDIVASGRLDFEEPDLERFPCLALAYRAIAAGGTATAVLNAANEVAVQSFLERRLPFTAIPQVIEATLDAVEFHAPDGVDAVLADDAQARTVAARMVARHASRAAP